MNIEFVLSFYNELDHHNNKAWFESQKPRYELVKKEIQVFCQYFLSELTKLDSNYQYLLPKDCVFRINRDVRFSKNKAPYKNNTGIYAAIGGKKSENAGFYLHLQPDNCFFAMGMYELEPKNLAKVRQEIDYNYENFSGILNQKSFKTTFGELKGEKLVNPPKGYEKENAAIEWIKHKSFIVTQVIDYKEITIQNLIEKCKLGLPFVNFLNQAIKED